MSKRLQIPISGEDDKLFRKVAKMYKVSASEWARRVLRKAAQRDLSADVVMDPLAAVRQIASLNAPVDDVETMKEQSVAGRLK